ncbi:MAG TPA: DUF3455 domain-containing protein [Chloroflexota bacterium]|nr:DUF3455 domain-containing protein [Chloroflexota bacterium]
MAHPPRTRFGTHARTLTAALAMLALMPGLAYAAKPTPPTVPTAIQAPAGNVPFLLGHAAGTQNYTCQLTSNGYAWTGVPSAKLVDDKGKEIMTHFGGPTWQAKDGSKVVGARVDGVTVSPDAIPWLLLRSTSTTAGPGGDQLVGTTFIQRVNTTGGLAPTGGCDAAHVGARHSAPYTSDYHFYRAAGSE